MIVYLHDSSDKKVMHTEATKSPYLAIIDQNSTVVLTPRQVSGLLPILREFLNREDIKNNTQEEIAT